MLVGPVAAVPVLMAGDAGTALTSTMAPLALAPLAAVLAVTLSRSGTVPVSKDPAEWEQTYWRWSRVREDDEVLFHEGEVTVTAHDQGRFRVLRLNGGIQSISRWEARECDEQAVAYEYLKVMLSVAAGMSPWMRRWEQDNTGAERGLRALFLGLGGGTLPSVLASRQSPLLDSIGGLRAVELDGSVATAARDYMGLSPVVDVVQADASDWENWHKGEGDRFDVVFVDIFDRKNQVPLVFQSEAFVAELRSRVLGDDGLVVANFHSDDVAAKAALTAGSQAYRAAFPEGSVLQVPCRYQGNTILAASCTKVTPGDAVSQATKVSEKARWPFDPVERLRGRIREL
jgi:hypothetical protein